MAVLIWVYLSLFEVDNMVLPWSSMHLDFVVHFQYRIAEVGEAVACDAIFFCRL